MEGKACFCEALNINSTIIYYFEVQNSIENEMKDDRFLFSLDLSLMFPNCACELSLHLVTSPVIKRCE